MRVLSSSNPIFAPANPLAGAVIDFMGLLPCLAILTFCVRQLLPLSTAVSLRIVRFCSPCS